MSDTNGNTPERFEIPSEFREMVHNAYVTRQELLTKLGDPRRNIEDECGFPDLHLNIDAWACQRLFDRDPFAGRVVDILPKETWKVHPVVHEDLTSGEVTEFEEAWSDLCQGVSVDPSWHRDDQASILYDYFKRLDIISGIGRYGVMLLGFDDGMPLDQPLPGFQENNSFAYANPSLNQEHLPKDFVVNTEAPPTPAQMMAKPYRLTVNASVQKLNLAYLRVFGETTAQITRFEANPTSPRHGMPVEYLLTLVDARDSTGTTAVGVGPSTARVHWSRVIHVADNRQSSEVFGMPRMQPLWNNLQSLRKIVHGSGEMYWKGAFPGLSIETHPSLGAEVTIDAVGARTAMEQYMNGLQRYLALPGVTAKSLAPQISDPTNFMNAQVEALCVRLGCPVRIFVGNESGEKASGQDERGWEGRVIERRNGYATCQIMAPFVDRMILLGVLPEPVTGYTITWPDSTSPTEDDKANVATKWANAMSIYVTAGLDGMMAPKDFLVTYMGFDADEAATILDNSLEWQTEYEEPLAAFGQQVPGNLKNPVATDSEGNPAKPGQTLDQAQGGQT